MHLDGTRCVACNSTELQFDGTDSRVVCTNCGHQYDIFEGVPCLVRYEREEVLSLIEILSIVGDERAPPSSQGYSAWAKHLDAYHVSNDREAYVNELSGSFQRYLPHRHRQYEVMQALLEGESLEGKHVLDIGAGEGFDTALIMAKGAKVTAMEFSPISAYRGAGATPGTNWFVGSGHALPFEDESFDVVACQATLHHMLHIPQCIEEALRVLKTGGLLLTISDSFRANRYDESFVCNRFDEDPAVLSGVNENVPRFHEFFETIDKHRDSLNVSMLTSIVYGYPHPVERKRMDLRGLQWWSIEDAKELADSSGGISFKIRKTAPITVSATTVDAEVIRPNALLADVKDKDKAMGELARFLPHDVAATPFPGAAGNTKFQLLNGWRKRTEEEDGRVGYNRARWYFVRQPEQTKVRISVSRVGKGPEEIVVVVDGVVAGTLAVSDQPTVYDVPAEHAAAKRVFAVELRCPEKVVRLTEGQFRVHQMDLV